MKRTITDCDKCKTKDVQSNHIQLQTNSFLSVVGCGREYNFETRDLCVKCACTMIHWLTKNFTEQECVAAIKWIDGK